MALCPTNGIRYYFRMFTSFTCLLIFPIIINFLVFSSAESAESVLRSARFDWAFRASGIVECATQLKTCKFISEPYGFDRVAYELYDGRSKKPLFVPTIQRLPLTVSGIVDRSKPVPRLLAFGMIPMVTNQNWISKASKR